MAELGDLILMAAALWLVYRLFEPIQRRLQRRILRFLDPKKADVIDVEPIDRQDNGGKYGKK